MHCIMYNTREYIYIVLYIISESIYVLQEPILFSTSIRENIAYGARDDLPTDDKIIAVAQQANAWR